jgi:hypothetical protein
LSSQTQTQINTTRLKSRVKGLLRRWRRGPSYQLVSGSEIGEEIEIASLVCPLRYDIIVRANFMAYYCENRHIYEEDLDAFLAHPSAQAYRSSWVKDAARSRPQIAKDKSFMQREFIGRMRRALALCDSLERNGYDDTYAIELRAANVIHHENGKSVERRFYAGDGCHRLAYHLLLGNKYLKRSQYQVRVYDEFWPRDNTYLLLGCVLRSESEYCRFISRYYCAGETFETSADILRHVEQHSPSLRDEVTSVMSIDLKRLAQTKTEEVASESSGLGQQR